MGNSSSEDRCPILMKRGTRFLTCPWKFQWRVNDNSMAVWGLPKSWAGSIFLLREHREIWVTCTWLFGNSSNQVSNTESEDKILVIFGFQSQCHEIEHWAGCMLLWWQSDIWKILHVQLPKKLTNRLPNKPNRLTGKWQLNSLWDSFWHTTVRYLDDHLLQPFENESTPGWQLPKIDSGFKRFCKRAARGVLLETSHETKEVCRAEYVFLLTFVFFGWVKSTACHWSHFRALHSCN